MNSKATLKAMGVCAVALFIGLAMFGCDSSTSPTEPVAANAAEAAQIGDVVVLRYPILTIMCAQQNDMEKVYIVGEQAMRQTYRVEHDARKAYDAERAAQKYAMASAYSCEWAPDKHDAQYVVQKKEIHGDKNALYHVADYCLRPQTGDDGKCLWISATADMNPQIVRVKAIPAKQ